MDTITTKKLFEDLEFKPYNPKFADTSKVIEGVTVHRAGLELAGLHKSKTYEKAIIGWGTKEKNYLDTLPKEEAKAAILNVLTKETPLLILSGGFDGAILEMTIGIANEFRIPILDSGAHLSELSVEVSSYLIRHNTKREQMHACLVVVNGVGVIIKGASGIGKSEAVLELVQQGHTFVADDTVIVTRLGSTFYGEPDSLTKGMLEARGIGIINVPFIYGAKSSKDYSEIELMVEIVTGEKSNSLDRLGNMGLKYKILGGSISKIEIPALAGRSLAAMIEAAVNVYLARKAGMDPLKTISERRDE